MLGCVDGPERVLKTPRVGLSTDSASSITGQAEDSGKTKTGQKSTAVDKS